MKQLLNQTMKCGDLDKRVNNFIISKKDYDISTNFFKPVQASPKPKTVIKKTLSDWRSIYVQISPLNLMRTNFNWCVENSISPTNKLNDKKMSMTTRSSHLKKRDNMHYKNGYSIMIDTLITKHDKLKPMMTYRSSKLSNPEKFNLGFDISKIGNSEMIKKNKKRGTRNFY